MSNVAALHLLLVRPATVMLLFFVAMAMVVPAMTMEPAAVDVVYSDFVRGGASAPLLQYALLLTVTSAAAVAILIANASLELQATDIAWTLPDLPRALVAGIATILLPGAVALAMLAARASTPGTGVAAAGIFAATCLGFLVTLDAVQPRMLRALAPALTLVALLRPAAYVALVERFPVIIAASGLAATALLLRQHVSRTAARRRPGTASQFVRGGRGLQLFWGALRGDSPEWTHSLAGAGLPGWLRAAAHEMAGGLKGNLPGMIAMLITLGVLSYVTSPSILMTTTFGLTYNGVQLRGTLAYPLSRDERARLFYAGTLIDALVSALVIGGTVLLLHVAHAPQVFPQPGGAREYMAMLGACVVLTPILQWARIRGPLPPDATKEIAGHFMHIIAFVAGAILIAALFTRWSVLQAAPARLSLMAALFLASQALHFVLVRRFFARADLVVER